MTARLTITTAGKCNLVPCFKADASAFTLSKILRRTKNEYGHDLRNGHFYFYFLTE